MDVTKYFYKNTNNLNIENIKSKKIKIVTHHWSNNYLVHLHIYNELDKLLPSLKNIEVTFIGNYINNYKPKNIILKSPMCGENLEMNYENITFI